MGVPSASLFLTTLLHTHFGTFRSRTWLGASWISCRSDAGFLGIGGGCFARDFVGEPTEGMGRLALGDIVLVVTLMS